MKRRTKLFRLFCFVILGIVCGGVLAGGASGSDAGALGYKRYQRIDFTFEPTLKLILSSNDLVIPNLNVDNSSDSNIISIETGTNVATGMQLTVTVGRDDSAEHVGEEGYEDPYNTTSLVNGENSFAALSGPAASLGSSDFGVNKWGYAYSTDNGTTWVNGDSNNTSNGYNGLPIHSGTGVKIVDTSDKVDANLQFKIGAKASVAQAAGEYTNIINFYAVTKVATTNYTVSYIDNSKQSQDMPTATGPIAITQDVEATISNSAPTRGGGYTFTGWCTASTNNNSCPGNYYQPGEKYPISNVGGDVAVNLYAMWKGPLIYDLVANQVKLDGNNKPRTQTIAELQAVIDASNSGVYLYNGAFSDVDNGYNIYYFRGILDSNLDGTTSTYGSNGNSAYHQNYVRLGNTCWRIVRTTASGGTKMIYNGLYSSGTTANSCANAQGNARTADRAFGVKDPSTLDDWYRNINRVGYTFNGSSDIQDTTTSTPVGTVFGDDSNYANVNKTDSNIKNYIENTWFTSDNGVSSYESMLEPSAGYCNDRSAYSDANGVNSLTSIPPYATSGATMYFGSYIRNMRANKELSLACPRGAVDLYTTKNASDGNKQLGHPVALLTADEAALAGSGYYGNTANTSSNYSYSSYLRSGSFFWLLSPNYRRSDGYAYGSFLFSNGYLYNINVNGGYGVRPAISLSHGTNISSGSGTATDPWVIDAP